MKNNVKAIIKDYLILTLGSVLMATGEFVFRFPNKFVFGGITGLSVELTHFFPAIPPTIFLTAMDILLMIAGVIFLGKSFGFKTFYIVAVSDVLMNTLQFVAPLNKPLTDEPVLEFILAVGLSAVSCAIFFNRNACSGGTDIIALIVKKFTKTNIGTALLVTDFIIVAFTFTVFSVKTALFSVCGLVIKSFLIDGVIANINRCKVFTIICSSPDGICDFVTNTLDRSATVQKAVGAYTGSEKYLVIAVVKQRQAPYLIDYLRKNCPDAFTSISNSSEIVGEGFRAML